MNDATDLRDKLRDTEVMIARFTTIAGEHPTDEADILNLRSLQRRKQKLEEQLSDAEHHTLVRLVLAQKPVAMLSQRILNLVIKFSDLIRQKDKTP